MENLSPAELANAIAACEQEPIRTPGSIQPHGFMLALNADLRIAQYSDNAIPLSGSSHASLLGLRLEDMLDASDAAAVHAELSDAKLRNQPAYVCAVNLPNGLVFDVLAHRFDGLIIVEFESTSRKAISAASDFRYFYPLVNDFLKKLEDRVSVVDMSLLAAEEIRATSGFGRVLVYRFDDEGHGHVLAESLEDGYESYLGQRFPASDIPRQARDLYVKSRLRLIPNADYTPSRLVPPFNPLTGQPTDLSFASLRSVSPVHLQYMRNMGTGASMSVSLIVKGRLWGLISCHHHAPLHVSFDRRNACEQLGQILSLRVETREDSDEFAFRTAIRRKMVAILAGLAQGPDFIDNLRGVVPELIGLMRAGGTAVVVDERILRCGNTPSEEQIRALVTWLEQNAAGDLFHSDHMSGVYPPAAEFIDIGSGVLAISISRIHKHYLIWFRPEVVKTIDWAGHPAGKVSDDSGRLTPRASFNTWREMVHASSVRWHAGELESAAEFRSALLAIALERAEQMAELAEELGRANKELEAFSYSVSHDLRAPLRHIVGFADLLLSVGGDETLVKRDRYLVNIKDAARLAGKLVDDLLSFSQMGRAALHPVELNMNGLVNTCIERLHLELTDRNVEWRIAQLPSVQADPNFIQLALFNLLSNALKFSVQRDPAVIGITGEDLGDMVRFDIQDNGVGFSMDYVHKLFGVFQRLHRMEDFQGTGIGLANVRRIVERHGGKVEAKSELGNGATFSFYLPKSFDDKEQKNF